MTFLSKIRQTVNALTQPIADPLDVSLELDGPDADCGPRATDLQYCRTMRQGASDVATARAWRKVEEAMALVPSGEVWMSPLISEEPGGPDVDLSSARVESLYIDRFPVTNEQFQQFVEDEGYNREEFWAANTLSYLLQFVDQTGAPGPKHWRGGKPPADKRKHPVTGISWYEAQAFAQWAGKFLPSPAQWQQSAVWFSTTDGPRGTNYPWGNVFNPDFTNTWHSGRGETVAIDALAEGRTPNGVHQLIGNVWEWTDSMLDLAPGQNGSRLIMEHPMAEVRGGAYDTYFETQATCQFRTGQQLIYRGPNVGFRCCVRVDDLPPQPDPSAFMLEPSA